jgi:hypothetical protein
MNDVEDVWWCRTPKNSAWYTGAVSGVSHYRLVGELDGIQFRNPKKLKIMIGTQGAIVKDLVMEAEDDKKQMIELEVELNGNVDTIEDLLRQIASRKQEITTLKWTRIMDLERRLRI